MLLVRWFIRFNTFRLNGILPKCCLELELNVQLARQTKTYLASVTFVVEHIGKPAGISEARIYRDFEYHRNNYLQLKEMDKHYDMLARIT